MNQIQPTTKATKVIVVKTRTKFNPIQKGNNSHYGQDKNKLQPKMKATLSYWST